MSFFFCYYFCNSLHIKQLEGLKRRSHLGDHSVDGNIILTWVSIFLLATDLPLMMKEENVAPESKR